MTDHTRWGFWPIKGAYGSTGGHVRCLGFTYGWIRQWDVEAKWSPSWSFDIFGIFYVAHDPCWGTRWALGKVSLKFDRARWRIGEREKARERRRGRRKLAALRGAHQ